jgi:hypothetical protein
MMKILEVQEMQGKNVLIQKGIIDKKTYYIPKDQIKNYDGNLLNFRISESDLKTN